MLSNNTHLTELQAQEQSIKARVELYNGSTLAKICNCGEVLEEFAVEKTGEGKYFGFGICQKLRTTLIDIHNTINPTAIDSIEASFGVDSDFIYPFPKFYIKEIERDEVFNVIKITAYDTLFNAANYTVDELLLPVPYTIKDFARSIAYTLGLPLVIDEAAASAFELYFPTPANFDGTETLRTALDAIAEATQTIYFIDSDWNLRFKRLDRTGAPVLTIGKNSYIELADDGARTLGTVAHITELGDNVEADAAGGDVQYIRNNPFWELREDIGTLVDNAKAATEGLAIHQFKCDWGGNYLLEIGDKITLTKDDDTTITTYVLDDNITYNGALWQINGWAYDGSAAESATNPTSLGDALNQTFARVDKVNKQITLLAQEVDGYDSRIAKIELDTGKIELAVSTANEAKAQASSLALTVEGISAEVSKKVDTTTLNNYSTTTQMNSAIKQSADSITTEVNKKVSTTDYEKYKTTVDEQFTSINQTADGINLTATSAKKIAEGASGKYDDLAGRVTKTETAVSSFDLTPYDAVLEFRKTVEENGVTKLDTKTGFTFDENGLKVEKSDSEIYTTISEDGMTITKSDDTVLTANNTGVDATNLRATTYLIIGDNSRLENYVFNGEQRTACFWIGTQEV